MKKYNRDKRAIYKANIRTQAHNNDACNGGDTHTHTRIRIHIPVCYDGCNRTTYIKAKIVPRTHAKPYNDMVCVDIPNIIHDIFPDISTHTQRIYKGTAPYKDFIPTPPRIPYSAPEDMMNTRILVRTNTRRVKCVIFDRHDNIIHMGAFTRTIESAIDDDGAHTTITLYRNNRSIEVRPYIPTHGNIYGYTLKDLRTHNVELYHI